MSNPEQGNPLQEIRLSEIEENDAIVLTTASGSRYHLLIVDTREDAPIVIMDRDSAQPVWRTDDLPAHIDDLDKFKLKGCCEIVSYKNGERLYPVDETEGYFKVNSRAWLTTDDDHNLITSTVESLELIKAD